MISKVKVIRLHTEENDSQLWALLPPNHLCTGRFLITFPFGNMSLCIYSRGNKMIRLVADLSCFQDTENLEIRAIVLLFFNED